MSSSQDLSGYIDYFSKKSFFLIVDTQELIKLSLNNRIIQKASKKFKGKDVSLQNLGIIIHPVVFLEYIKTARKIFFRKGFGDPEESISNKDQKLRIQGLIESLTWVLHRPEQLSLLKQMFHGFDVCWATLLKNNKKTTEKVNLYSNDSMIIGANFLLNKKKLPAEISGWRTQYEYRKINYQTWFCKKIDTSKKEDLFKQAENLLWKVSALLDLRKLKNLKGQKDKKAIQGYLEEIFNDAWKISPDLGKRQIEPMQKQLGKRWIKSKKEIPPMLKFFEPCRLIAKSKPQNLFDERQSFICSCGESYFSYELESSLNISNSDWNSGCSYGMADLLISLSKKELENSGYSNVEILSQDKELSKNLGNI